VGKRKESNACGAARACAFATGVRVPSPGTGAERQLRRRAAPGVPAQGQGGGHRSRQCWRADGHGDLGRSRSSFTSTTGRLHRGGYGTNFEKEFGVKVTYTRTRVTRRWSPSSRPALRVRHRRASGISSPSCSHRFDQPVNKTYLTNFNNVSPFFRTCQRSGEQATVPGSGGRPHRVPARQGKDPGGQLGCVSRQAVRQEDDHDGRGREVIGAFLRYRGHSLNSTNPAELSKARPIRSQPKAVEAYISRRQGPAHFGHV